MAHSPPLRTASLIASTQFNRQSPSPPLHQPLSKRDKRRHNMEERLAQLTHDFAENRESYYRKQIQAFQSDIEYVLHSNPYTNKPLDDFPLDVTEEATISAAASNHGSVRAGGLQMQTNGNLRLDASHKTGMYAAMYTKEMNDAMEERDANLTTTAYRHNFAIHEMRKDHDFNVAVALEEHQRLFETLKTRLGNSLRQKKAQLQREKEKLDIADTNALLFNPNQFSVTNGASPGGPQSNRKTRHTRHRLEMDDMDAAEANRKRKRKGPADADNGSPAPAGREPEPANPTKAANPKAEYQQVTPPLYSIDRLFTQRELDQHLQQSTFEVIDNLKRRKLNSETNLPSLIGTNPSSSDTEDNDNPDIIPTNDGAADDVFFGAPVMERTTTNASQHATRSTRTANPTTGTTGREGLGSLAGRYAGAQLIGTYTVSQRREKTREDDSQRAPPLTEQEQEDDMALYKAAIEDEDAGKSDKLFLEDVVEVREDYVGTGLEELEALDAEEL